MSGYSFRPTPVLHSAPEWRELDIALARWVIAHGGSPLVARTAAWASLADGHGDTALALAGEGAGRHGMPLLSDADTTSLIADPMVADGATQTPTPFVVENGLFYLWRNFAQEVQVARLLRDRRADAAPQPLDETSLDILFHHDRDPAVQAQRLAVQRAPGRKLFVLTGGPGTGKTTTVLRILLGLLHQAGDRQLTVRIAAPTGKAAQRLAQSLREGKQAIANHPGRPLPDTWRPLLDRIPDDEPLTLHRLLGADGRSQRFRHHADAPLAADIVVVDEASMIDLSLLRGLLAALRPEASLILVGDPDQLTSVGAGSVLMDLVDALGAEGADDLVRLEHRFRAGDALVPILMAVREGDVAGFQAAWQAAGDHAVHHEAGDTRALAVQVRRWAQALHEQCRRQDLLSPIDGDGAPRQAALRLAAMHERQLLCALREGEFGATAIGARIESFLRAATNQPDAAVWYPGRLVMITRNDFSAGLFNGDIGLCLPDGDGRLWLWFEASDASGQPGARRFAPGLAPTHSGAFAITIHKSQGSEYGQIGIVLPPDPEQPVLTRQLLYTAISRARSGLIMIGSQRAVARSLEKRLLRRSGLALRIGRA